jgi:hypothetical protein
VAGSAEGAAVAAERSSPGAGSLKTAWSLDVLRMDHTSVDLIVSD